MKRFRHLVFLLAAAVALTLLPSANVMKVSAEGPTTYSLMYVTKLGEWRFQVGGWESSSDGRELYYLDHEETKMKDGDIVVVYANESNTASRGLSFNVHLSNLTINRVAVVVDVPKGIDDCFVLGDSYTAISGPITNAYVYDHATCTFNSNVNTMTITGPEGSEAVVTAAGTVGHLIEGSYEKVHRELYNFTAGKLAFGASGNLLTDPKYYSTTPSAAAPASAPAVAAAQPVASPEAASSEDVYIVQRGDTLSKIARDHGMTVKQLAALNPQIKNINLIWAKQKIFLK